MANETLIGQLDALRETYTQQQRAATALQTTFKAVVDTQNKAQRALREASAQNVALDAERAQQAFAQVRLKEEAIDPLLPELRRELKNLAGLLGGLKDAIAALKAEPVDVVRLDKAITALQMTKQKQVLDLLPELGQELELGQRRLGDEFGAKLRDALAEQGIEIGGRSPRFEIGRFELEANFAKRSLVLSYGKDIVVPRVPITVEAALKAYQGAYKAIYGRNQDGKAWVAQFHEAYQIARRKRAQDNPRVNIVEVYLELVLLRQSRAFAGEPSKRTFSEYPRAQFIYDFEAFSDGRVVKAHSATKSQTDRPTASMWIVDGNGPYDGRYIADVEFVKE